MKTVQELFQEIMSSEELKAQAVEAAKTGKLEAFLKDHGCEATMEEVAAFLKEKAKTDVSLSLNELENVAGGECNDKTTSEVLGSILGIFGTHCLGTAFLSALGGYVGQEKPGDGRLCNKK